MESEENMSWSYNDSHMCTSPTINPAQMKTTSLKDYLLFYCSNYTQVTASEHHHVLGNRTNRLLRTESYLPHIRLGNMFLNLFK